MGFYSFYKNLVKKPTYDSGIQMRYSKNHIIRREGGLRDEMAQ